MNSQYREYLRYAAALAGLLMGVGTLLNTCAANSNTQKDTLIISNNNAEVRKPEYTGYSCIHYVNSDGVVFEHFYPGIGKVPFEFIDPQILQIHENMIFGWDSNCAPIDTDSAYYVGKVDEDKEGNLIYIVN